MLASPSAGADRHDGRGHRSLRGDAGGGRAHPDDGGRTVGGRTDGRLGGWIQVSVFFVFFLMETLCLQPPSRAAEGLQ